MGILQKVVEALQKMESFCRTKKNMFLPIRDGIGDAPYQLGKLKMCLEDRDTHLDNFEYQVSQDGLEDKGGTFVKKKRRRRKGQPKLPTDSAGVHPEPRKRQRQPTVNPHKSVSKKSKEKRPRTLNKEEEWTRVAARKELRKQKP